MSLGTDIVEAAVQDLSRKAPWERDRVQWRCGHFAFNAICEAAHRIDDMDAHDWPELQKRIDKANEERAEELAEAKSKWGQPGSLLFGIPIVCDETYSGLRLEPIDPQSDELWRRLAAETGEKE